MEVRPTFSREFGISRNKGGHMACPCCISMHVTVVD
jgi:hypothetical protein